MNARLNLADSSERPAGSIGVVFDAQRNVAILEKGGTPIGTAFRGFRQGAFYIDAATAAEWFLFGARLQGVNPAELGLRDFLAAKGGTNNLLGYAAWSATRCAVTDRTAIAAFFEAAFRGKLKDYELAFHRLASSTGSKPDDVAKAFNTALREWNWLVECAVPDVDRALRGIPVDTDESTSGESTTNGVSP